MVVALLFRWHLFPEYRSICFQACASQVASPTPSFTATSDACAPHGCLAAVLVRHDPDIEYCPHCYNSRGPGPVKARSAANTEAAAALEWLGGADEFPLTFGRFADNGNYLEPDEVAVRHGICGDPAKVGQPGRHHVLVAVMPVCNNICFYDQRTAVSRSSE